MKVIALKEKNNKKENRIIALILIILIAIASFLSYICCQENENQNDVEKLLHITAISISKLNNIDNP